MLSSVLLNVRKKEVREYFKEISYGSLIIDLEIYWSEDGSTERIEVPSDEVLNMEQWYRLRILRPSFASLSFHLSVCLSVSPYMSHNGWSKKKVTFLIPHSGCKNS